MEHDERTAASNRVEGSVVGQSVQAGVIHGGVHFTVSPSRRPSAGELPDEVMSLLRAQVRAVAADASVAWYVRRRAACFLARWSEVCREEARALIREFDRASG